MKEVRELSYDMEDSFDEFMIRVGDKSDPESLINQEIKRYYESVQGQASS
jgi:hypothetical protein